MKTGSFRFNKLHPLVQTLLIGTIIVNMARSMCAPFFAIYLSNHTSLTIGTIGFIVGMGAVAGMFGGFVGGSLSDLFGRERIMLGSLFVEAFTYGGYAFFHNPLMILSLILLSGFFGAFFNPTSKAMIADVTEQAERVKVFSWQYVGVNIGYTVGPILGIAVGIAGGAAAFLIMSLIHVGYFIAIAFLVKKYPLQKSFVVKQGRSFFEALHVLKQDRSLLLFILGGLLTTVVHGQWSTPISLFLTHSFTNGVTILSYLLTTNALVVILFQPLLSKWMHACSSMQNIAVGSILLALGSVLFAIATSWPWFVFGMVIFTVGEVLIVPSEYRIIDEITPAHLRGSYFGATSFTSFGNFLGPWLFNLALVHISGTIMFLAMAACAFLGMVVYWSGSRYSVSHTIHGGKHDKIATTPR